MIWSYAIFLTVSYRIYHIGASVCSNEICKVTAQRILDHMDPNVNPCEDFYQYSCGNFIRNTKIPPDKVSVGTQSLSFNVVEKQLNKLFIKSHKGLKEPMPIINLRKYFELCMDQVTIDKRGLSTAIHTIQKAGSWPILDKNWKSSSWTFMEAEHKLIHLLNGNGVLLMVTVTEDVMDRTRRLILIDGPDIGMREFLIRGRGDTTVEAYYQYMKDVMSLLGVDIENMTSDLNDVMEFQMELAKVLGDRDEKRNLKRYKNVMTLQHIQKTWPWMDWTIFLKGLMPKDLYLEKNEKIVIRFPEYITNLGKILERFTKKIVANYIMWSSFQNLAPYLTSQIQNLSHKLNIAKIGIHDQQPRSTTCLSLSKKAYRIAFSALYATNNFNESSKLKAIDMVEAIRLEAVEIIREVNWMDNQTKERAINKATKIQEDIAYPDKLLDETELNLYHKDLNMNTTFFLEANLDLMKWHRNKHWANLRRRTTGKEWYEHVYVMDINAFYNPLRNAIVLPAAVLQPPFFHADLPWYYNYGVLGTVIGHEITHGFDDQGHMFDEFGQMKNWWDTKSKENFDTQKQCIIEQYSEFNDTRNTNLKLNGVTGQGENIADNGAVRLTHRAYRKKGFSPEPKLPGLESFSDEQMMFLSYANFWCVSQRKEYIRYNIVSAPHALPEFRVKGPFINFLRFSKAFGCQKNDFMNPKKKCRVW